MRHCHRAFLSRDALRVLLFASLVPFARNIFLKNRLQQCCERSAALRLWLPYNRTVLGHRRKIARWDRQKSVTALGGVVLGLILRALTRIHRREVRARSGEVNASAAGCQVHREQRRDCASRRHLCLGYGHSALEVYVQERKTPGDARTLDANLEEERYRLACSA